MHLVNLHTHRAGSQANEIAIVNQYPDEFGPSGFYSVGIHPWQIDETKVDEHLDFIESKMSDANCLAIGECGLDKRVEADFALQKMVFQRQLELAEKHAKPVIIHCVAAYQETIEMCAKLTIPKIIHGFSKNSQVAESLIAAGFYLSFGKWLIQNPELGNVLVSIPLDKLFLETDSSDFAIGDIYQKASEHIKTDNWQQQLLLNFESVFQIEIDNLK